MIACWNLEERCTNDLRYPKSNHEKVWKITPATFCLSVNLKYNSNDANLTLPIQDMLEMPFLPTDPTAMPGMPTSRDQCWLCQRLRSETDSSASAGGRFN